MGTIVRGTKRTGGTAFTDGSTIYSDEVNTDLDTAYSEINGNLADANVVSAANIDPGKIGDYSATDAEQATASTPGVSGSTTKPTTLEGELEKLRYKLEEAHLGIDAVRVDGTGTVTCSWIDVPYRPVNLIYNPEFAFHTSGTPAAPNGWTLGTAPGVVELEAMAASAGPGKALRIVASGGSDQGILQTLDGTRAGARYLFVVRCKATSGTAKIETTGADAASSFRDVEITTTSATYVTKAFVVQADSSANDIAVYLLAESDTDDVSFASCHAYECASDAIVAGQNYAASAEYSGYVAGTDAAFYPTGAATSSGVSVGVIPPGPGYQIHVVAKPMAEQASGAGSDQILFRLLQNTVEVDCAWANGIAATGKVNPAMHYVNAAPAAGTLYTYTMTGQPLNVTFKRNGEANTLGETRKTRIYVTLVKA